MFNRKAIITRADRDRLVEMTRMESTALRWALFVDELARQINRARIVPPHRVPADVVTMHSKVQFLDPQRRGSGVYTLVYPEEANPSQGKLSVLSPLGAALLGARPGDVVRVDGAAGPRGVKVQSVLYQPEAADRSASVASKSNASRN
jgi:regulator of nucleoside diphosphate kinase